MKQKIESAAQFIKESGISTIDLGIILGTGLGKLSDLIQNPIIIPYSKIPNFPISTVEFHAGELYYGPLFGKNVLAFKGRFHLYEGYDYFQITFPIRLLNALSAKKVILSNAAGGINLNFQKGDLMMITDHIHLQGGSPLAIKGIEKLGDRFVDMCHPYSESLRNKSLSIAKKLSIDLQQGVYVSVVGSQLETAAEYRFLKIIGSDAVGMSTTAEVIVARQLKMEVLAFTIITDLCDPDNLKPINLKDIFASASIGEEKLIDIIRDLIPLI
ncbi:MAG: purine-nucleoside phosphorylase [Flavobacteriaceae bacterium]|nr:purine-nucleoside phosphorylase [Flavobacteriaceae bacterium]